MTPDPIYLTEMDFSSDLVEDRDRQVRVEFVMEGGDDSICLYETLECSPSPSTEEYTQIVRNAAAALRKRLVRSADFLAQKYNL